MMIIIAITVCRAAADALSLTHTSNILVSRYNVAVVRQVVAPKCGVIDATQKRFDHRVNAKKKKSCVGAKVSCVRRECGKQTRLRVKMGELAQGLYTRVLRCVRSMRACVRARLLFRSFNSRRAVETHMALLSVRLASTGRSVLDRRLHKHGAWATFKTARVPFTFLGVQQRMDKGSGVARWLPFGSETMELGTPKVDPGRGEQ